MSHASPQPAIGRIVHYKLKPADCERINIRRSDAQNSHAGSNISGYVVHVGNPVRDGDVFPMMIVRSWENGMVNGQVFLDGNDTLWVTSAEEGTEAGQFSWPVPK